MTDLLWIIPNLNEKPSTIKSNLLKFFNYSRKKRYTSRIVLSDGGSQAELLVGLRQFIKEFNDEGTSVEVDLCFPIMHPNKNLGILNTVQKYSAKHVLIIDADWTNIDEECLEQLIAPLFSGEAKIVLPEIVRKKSARINRLVISPLLRLFFPEVARRIKFPLAGMVGIEYKYLKEVVNSPDYLWDWGGEAQIVIRGFTLSNGSIKTFDYPKKESKKRDLSSKKKDALQIIRAIIYEGFITERLDVDTIRDNLYSTWVQDKELRDGFLQWQKQKNIQIISHRDDLKQAFNDFFDNCNKDLLWFSDYVDQLYSQTNIYEISVLKSIAVDCILKALFGIKLEHKLTEAGPDIIEKMNLIDLSIFVDVIFTVYICLWLERSSSSKGFDDFLGLLSPEDTDFADAAVVAALKQFRNNNLTSRDINDIPEEILKKIIGIFTNKEKNIIQKNKALSKIL